MIWALPLATTELSPRSLTTVIIRPLFHKSRQIWKQKNVAISRHNDLGVLYALQGGVT